MPIKPLTLSFRFCIPFLGIIALIALFLKLPEAAHFFTRSTCGSCLSKDPYMPLIGCGYFGFLIAASLLFPTFPNRTLAFGGWIGSIALACALTYIHLPDICLACLIGHACNILIWSIWFFVRAPEHKSTTLHLGTRFCILLFAPLSVIALFSSLNLTLLAYNPGKPLSNIGLHTGDPLPSFIAQTLDGKEIANTNREAMILNFITPNCTYCKEQLQILHQVKSQLPNTSYRIINISPILLPELIQQSPLSEWIEDKGAALQKSFKIQGFPTLYVVGSDEKILRVIQGVPKGLQEELQNDLLTSPAQ